MSLEGHTLVCFAVKEEGKAFREKAVSLAQVEVLITGIGAGNAERAIRGAIVAQRPGLVLSCGFAGGLRPGLESGAVMFCTAWEGGLETALAKAGAKAGKFHCAPRVATTAAEKRALWESGGADAVEMESQIISEVCREKNIPCATVRVILDTAEEDLPLDFNRLMNEEQAMDYGKLALTLLKSPRKIGALMQLQRQSRAAAGKLAEVLVECLRRE